jgi:hypothetical protein
VIAVYCPVALIIFIPEALVTLLNNSVSRSRSNVVASTMVATPSAWLLLGAQQLSPLDQDPTDQDTDSIYYSR